MKSILVFRSAALGDFILSSPAFFELRNIYLGYNIVLLTIQSSNNSQRAKVASYTGDVEQLPWINLVFPHLIDDVLILRSLTDFKYLFSLRKKLQSFHFENAIVLSDIWAPLSGRLKKRLLMYFLLGRTPVLGWMGGGNQYKLKRKGLLRHHVHGPLQFLSELDPPRQYEDSDIRFDLRPGKEADFWVETWLREMVTFDVKYTIAIAPGSIQPHKRWPIGSYKNLLRLLLNRYEKACFLVIGTSADRNLGYELSSIEPERVYNLAGVTDILKSAALLRKCDLLIGNDGGAVHLGDSMGCKVVSIIPGIEFPDSIEPWFNKDLAIRHDINCSPCYNFLRCPMGHNRCMTEITVQRVFQNCTTVLDRN
jgi:heptosyltransferase-2